MSFHPTESKPLIFAGDKVGNLGILDGSQNPQTSNNGIKREDAAEDEEAEEDPDPIITTIKPHSRTISAMHIHPADPSKLYTASYDSSIRALDLEKSVATEAYAPASTSTEEPLSGVDMAPDDPHVLYFTTLDGVFGRYDTRTQGSGNKPDVYALSEKKIGGFSLCPSQPHYLAMASLDRTMRLWDLRKLSKKNPTPVGEHESSLSVSHAAFNSVGQVATSSYDNSLKVYDFSAKGLHSWAAGHRLSAEDMEPSTVLKHNCQTGKWVTM
jgi:WD40 repeat protein